MSKYKVGDRVRIRSDLTVDGFYPMADSPKQHIFVHEMDKLRGKTVTITSAGHFGYEISGSIYSWTDAMFDGLADCDKKIIVTTDGTTTLARLYEGKKVINRAEAKCSPEDTFDFEIGARLAMERLIGEEKPTEPEFEVGDIVRIKNAKPYHMYAKGVVCKVIRAAHGELLTLVSDGLMQEIYTRDVEKIKF